MQVKIAIIGTGYVGLVSAVCFSELGHKVTAIDIDKEKISALKNKKIPIFEPEIKKLLSKNLDNGNLIFSDDLKVGIKDQDVCFIAVGTPHNEKTNQPNLDFVWNALESIIDNINNDILIVNKSTVPIGTAFLMKDIIAKHKKYKISLASNPEFLSQGTAVRNFLEPQRIVVGIDSKDDELLLKKIYQKFIDKKYPFIVTNISSAELIKYSANSFLAMKVAFINEIACLSEEIGANIDDIKQALSLDNRIGDKFLNAGPGYGGSCFPKDTQALRKVTKNYHLKLPLIQNIDVSNNLRIKNISQKIKNILVKHKENKITMLGLSFKTGTDDVRNSQSLKIINFLQEENIKISAFDPQAKIFLKKTEIFNNLDQALKNSKIICVVTDWPEFKNIPKTDLADKIIIDLRGIYKKFNFEKDYYLLGKNL